MTGSGKAHKGYTDFEKLLSGIPEYHKLNVDRNGMSVQIRNMQAGDVSGLLGLVCNVEREEPNSGHLPYEKAKANLEEALKSTNPIILVAEQDNNVVAYVWGYDLIKGKHPELDGYLLGPHSHVSYISDIAVEPSHRRQGIAEQLLNAYRILAKQKGADDLILDTINPKAEKLYEKLHYKPATDPASKKELVYKEGRHVFRAMHLDI